MKRVIFPSLPRWRSWRLQKFTRSPRPDTLAHRMPWRKLEKCLSRWKQTSLCGLASNWCLCFIKKNKPLASENSSCVRVLDLNSRMRAVFQILLTSWVWHYFFLGGGGLTLLSSEHPAQPYPAALQHTQERKNRAGTWICVIWSLWSYNKQSSL